MYRNFVQGKLVEKRVIEQNPAEQNSTTENVLEQTAKHALQLLLARKFHVSFVESCTGGMAASEFIGMSGASGAIEQSFITYSNDAKHKMVGVSISTLEKFGAISAQTASEMAEGGALKSGSDICISITGNAGPVAEEGKPVGLVYIGCFCEGNTDVYEFNLQGTRQEIRKKATAKALEVLVEKLRN